MGWPCVAAGVRHAVDLCAAPGSWSQVGLLAAALQPSSYPPAAVKPPHRGWPYSLMLRHGPENRLLPAGPPCSSGGSSARHSGCAPAQPLPACPPARLLVPYAAAMLCGARPPASAGAEPQAVPASGQGGRGLPSQDRGSGPAAHGAHRGGNAAARRHHQRGHCTAGAALFYLFGCLLVCPLLVWLLV